MKNASADMLFYKTLQYLTTYPLTPTGGLKVQVLLYIHKHKATISQCACGTFKH